MSLTYAPLRRYRALASPAQPRDGEACFDEFFDKWEWASAPEGGASWLELLIACECTFGLLGSRAKGGACAANRRLPLPCV
eukprot:15054812-Alexandrium_andersonii.AAC.1